MNDFFVGAFKSSTGWIAYYQLPNRPDRTYISHEGDRLIFESESEAKAEAYQAFVKALQRSLISGLIAVTVSRPKARADAEAIFKHGRKIPVEQSGERRRAAV